MKFGEYLEKNQDRGWADKYINYGYLKQLIKDLQSRQSEAIDPTARITSLSVPRPTDSAGMPMQTISTTTPEDFFTSVESEMRKIDDFTHTVVVGIRNVLRDVERQLTTVADIKKDTSVEDMQVRVDAAAEKFLRLEKYVNLNFTGFHKILKKHDKRIKGTPVKPFYIERLHQQSWIQMDHSDVIVTMSRVYSALRGDEDAVASESAKQVRNNATVLKHDATFKCQ